MTLLKDNGKLCYIIPQTILVNPDFDVLRYHLANFVTIEKVFTFSSHLFISRGLKQKKIIPTSSLIFVIKKQIPKEKHQVEIINYVKFQDTIKETLENILARKNIKAKKVLQSDLLRNITNWNFIKQGKTFLNFYKEYKENTDDIKIYYNHLNAQNQFNSKFYFDGGAIINEKFLTSRSTDAYEVVESLNSNSNCLLIPQSNKFYPKDNETSFPQGSQGIVTFLQRNKIIWRTKNITNFQFIDRDVILVTNKYLTISSNNKNEILYLLSLLNSTIIKFYLNNIIKVPGEDTSTILVSLRVIKEQIRVPKITKENQFIKDNIIKQTERMLELEEKRLSDFVDFSKVMLQKFDKVSVESNDLFLEKDDEKIKLAVKENQGLVKKSLNERYGKQIIELEKQKISLSELKDLPVIDYEKQNQIKEYIDDLVFALYFNINVKKIGLNKATEIKSKLLANKYYNLIKTRTNN